MQKRFKIEFRRKQLYLDQDISQPVVVQLNVDGSVEYVPGLVPDYTWTDVTESTAGQEGLQLDWTATTEDSRESDSSGTSELGSNYQKGLSGDLTFFAEAFKYIFNWLMVSPEQSLNCVEVRITDMECQKAFRLFELKLDNTDWSPEDDCIITMPLREADFIAHVFQKTIIEDNWQNWFNTEGTSTKDHPTFGMVVEKKPKFFSVVYTILIYLAGIISAGVLIALTEGKKWISRSMGFTYFTPSPLIRTYIENICQKYGFTHDTIFDDVPENPYRDLCFFWPASTSLKEFRGGNYTAPSTKFIWENRSGLSFTKFLDQLKKVFNAQWYVTPDNKLVFKHKSFFQNQAPIYDFTNGNDKIYKLKYSFNGNKKPAYGDYQYQIDPQDTCSNELKWRYNDKVDFDGPANNPMLEGNITKNFDFACTSFHNDGSSIDFLEAAIRTGRTIASGAIVVGLGQLLAGTGGLTVFIAVGLVALGYAVTNNYMNDYFDNGNLNGMVRVSNSELNIPRLLLWDRATALGRAKVVSVTDPGINPKFNTVPIDYYEEHPTFDGENTFGTDVTKVYNYPMYLDALFTNNLYDRFHDFDNPLSNPAVNQSWEGEVDLCCEWLDRLGVWDGDFVKIGSVVTLENRQGRMIKGQIEGIKMDYKTGRIYLNGTVIK